MDWQPIETAPKDGGLILIGSKVDYLERHRWHVQSAFWSQKDPYGMAWWEVYGGGYVPFEPTHWMPIPPPPQTEQ